jgi:hypothetical protein
MSTNFHTPHLRLIFSKTKNDAFRCVILMLTSSYCRYSSISTTSFWEKVKESPIAALRKECTTFQTKAIHYSSRYTTLLSVGLNNKRT